MNRLFAQLDNPSALKCILLTTAILFLPSLFAGLHGDDLFHFTIINNSFPLHVKNDISLFGLFSFFTDDPLHRSTLLNHAMQSWWSKPDFLWQFWRPVTEISQYIDYKFFASFPWVMHLHSIVCFLLMTALLAHLFTLLEVDSKILNLAVLIFAFNCSHAITVSWLANRSSLLAGTFGLLTLIFHFKTSTSNTYLQITKLYCLSLLALGCTLLSGEIGVSIGGFLFAFAVFLDPRGFKKGFIALLPYLSIVMIWMYIHKTNNMGVKGSSWGYIDPFAYPELFFEEFKVRYPLIVLSQLLSIPVDVFSLFPGKPYHISINLGYMSFIAILLGMAIVKKQAKLFRFFCASYLITIIPTTINPPEARNMIFVSMASAGIVAILMLQLYGYYKTSNNRGLKIFAATIINLLIFLHLILSPLLIPIGSYVPKKLAEYNGILAKSLNFSATDKLVLFGYDQTMYLVPQMAINKQTIPEKMWGITHYHDKFTSRKLSEHEILLTSDDGFFSHNDPTWLKRSQIVDFNKTTFFLLDGLSINVLSVNQIGFPTSLKLTFSDEIQNITFIKLKGNGYEKLDMSKEMSFAP